VLGNPGFPILVSKSAMPFHLGIQAPNHGIQVFNALRNLGIQVCNALRNPGIQVCNALLPIFSAKDKLDQLDPARERQKSIED
jgi:hypothetical protein